MLSARRANSSTTIWAAKWIESAAIMAIPPSIEKPIRDKKARTTIMSTVISLEPSLGPSLACLSALPALGVAEPELTPRAQSTTVFLTKETL